MASFKEKLTKSGKEVLNARAQNILSQTKLFEDSYIQDLKRKVLEIQGKIAAISDVAIKDSTSLTPGGPGFNPEEWIKQRHSLQLQLRDAKIRLKVALQVDSEEFPATDFSDDDLIGDLNGEE